MQSPTVGPKRNRRYATRKLDVIQGAARVFARLGYHGSSLNDVANELGMTPAALYYYVRSKDELLLEANIYAAGKIKRAFLEICEDTDSSALRKIVTYFRFYAECMTDDFGRCLALTTPNDLPSPLREKSLEQRRELTDMVQRLIREGIAEGSIQSCDDRLLAFTLYAAANTLARWYASDGPQTAGELMDAMLMMLVNGLIHPPLPDGFPR